MLSGVMMCGGGRWKKRKVNSSAMGCYRTSSVSIAECKISPLSLTAGYVVAHSPLQKSVSFQDSLHGGNPKRLCLLIRSKNIHESPSSQCFTTSTRLPVLATHVSV